MSIGIVIQMHTQMHFVNLCLHQRLSVESNFFEVSELATCEGMTSFHILAWLDLLKLIAYSFVFVLTWAAKTKKLIAKETGPLHRCAPVIRQKREKKNYCSFHMAHLAFSILLCPAFLNSLFHLHSLCEKIHNNLTPFAH
ncbi:MAG: hypothetical protein U5Q03_15705 [Bacteroidota bacterium]|nr:hypothetical protein [Bacteroidota bacterium]